MTRQRAKVTLIGEGCHFKSFRVNSHGPVALVLSIATSGFKDGLVSGYNKWALAMARLKPLRLPLVPPFEILRHEDADHTKIALVTPYGGEKEVMASAHWQPLAGHIDSLNDGLKDHELSLDDVAQIRCLEGMPFVIDWSDLMTL